VFVSLINHMFCSSGTAWEHCGKCSCACSLKPDAVRYVKRSRVQCNRANKLFFGFE